MNKSISILLMIILSISSCNKLNAGKVNNANIPLSEFVIGNWKSELQSATDIYGDYQIEYQVEFLNKSKLTFCNRNPREILL